MTDLLDGRALDLALAEVTDALCIRWGTCDTPFSSHTVQPNRKHPYWPPEFSLDLIAAAEEPLVKAGWAQEVSYDRRTGWRARWIPRDASLTAPIYAPTEKIARGNAAYRALLKLKEETNANYPA